jgi:hypothetical protein
MKYRGQDIANADWVGVFAILLLLISGCLFTYYFIVAEIHDCTSSPLNYAASKALEKNVSYSYVELRIFQNENDIVPIDIVKINLKPETSFNEKNIPRYTTVYRGIPF